MKKTNRILKIIAFLLSSALIACTNPTQWLPPDEVNQVGSQASSEIKPEVPPETEEWASWTDEDGRLYEGEWQNNMKHGKGTLTWPDGARYEGEWRNDMAHGKGILTWRDGERGSSWSRI